MIFVKVAAVYFLMFGLFGCAENDRSMSWVANSERYWDKSGFSIKPPSGSNWIKLPVEDNAPNMIKFGKIDPKPFSTQPNNPSYDGTLVLAISSVLDEPIQNRKDTDAFSKTIMEHINRYHAFGDAKINLLTFDNSFGLDCLRFKWKHNKERIQTKTGEFYFGEAIGYFCLHPEHDNFGVFMTAKNGASTGFKLPNRDDQAENFFKSLKFLPILKSIPRTFEISNFQVGKSPYQLTLFQGKIWAALKDENRVVQVDPSNGKVLAAVEVGRQPVSIAGGEKSIWVANSGDETVTRIDPTNAKVVATIPVTGKPISISVGRGGVWVASSTENSIKRINPIKNIIVATIAVGKEPMSVNASNDGIWTANAGDGTVTLIDPAHDWPINTIKIGGRPIRISLNKSGAWVADEANKTVVRIERKTRNVIARIDVGMMPKWIYSTEDDIFVALSDDGKIVRIDPAQNRIFGPAINLESMPRGMVYHNGSLWTANSGGTTLSQINLKPFGQVIGIQPP